jgi:hypothetical protein
MQLTPGKFYTLEQYAQYFSQKNIPQSQFKDSAGGWHPLLPDQLGRELDPIEMDYNLALINKGIAQYRLYSATDAQLTGKDLTQADAKKVPQLQYDKQRGAYYFQLTSLPQGGTSGSGAGGTSGTSGTSGTDGEQGPKGNPGTSGTSGQSAGSATAITRVIDNFANNNYTLPIIPGAQTGIEVEEALRHPLVVDQRQNSQGHIALLLTESERPASFQLENISTHPLNIGVGFLGKDVPQVYVRLTGLRWQAGTPQNTSLSAQLQPLSLNAGADPILQVKETHTLTNNESLMLGAGAPLAICYYPQIPMLHVKGYWIETGSTMNGIDWQKSLSFATDADFDV